MSTTPAQVARSYVAPGTVWDVARNRDHTTGAGALLPQDLGATTDRPGVWLQWEMLAGFPVAHGTVADEAAMLALHTFGMDSADNPTPRYVAPGDSCTRTDDPGWRWHCIAGNGTTLAEWERRPLAGALTGLAVSGHTHTISDVTGLQTALDGKQPALSNAAVVAQLTDTGGALAYRGAVIGGGGSSTSLESLIVALAPVAWYRADAGTLDADGTACTDGVAIATWQDQSGHGYHLAQATTGSRPTLKTVERNGLPVVRFDGVDDYLLCAGFPSLDLSDCTVIVVCAQRVGTGDGGIWVLGASGVGEPYGTTSGTYAALGGDTSHFVAGANTTIPSISGTGSTPWAVWSHRTYGGTVSAGKNGLIVESGSGLVGIGLTGFLLGAYWLGGPTSFSAIDVAELLVFPRALPDGAIGIIAGALRARWSV